MKKVHWLKHINNEHSNYEACPMYEDETLVYKSFVNRPDIVFDENTSDDELKKYNFYRVVANTVPDSGEQTLDGVKVKDPIEVHGGAVFERIAPRTLHMYYNYNYLDDGAITRKKMQLLAFAKNYLIDTNIITKKGGEFSWREQNLLHWILTRDTMPAKGTSSLLDENGKLIDFTKKEITELVDEASKLRSRLETDVANIIKDGKSKTLMEYYKMDVEQELLKKWNVPMPT